MDTEEQRVLVEAARSGNPDAWEKLYRNVYPRLYAFAVHRLGPTPADDVVAETMARAVAAIGRYRWQPAGLDPWLFGIARRVIAEHQRSDRRARRWPPKLHGDITAPPAPGEALEAAEAYVAVRRLLDRLPGADREVLELRVIAGLSADDCARVLGKRPGAVRTAQSRALARLRQLMRSEP